MMGASALLPPRVPRLTVVLDLDETLIHYNEELRVRPGCLELLRGCEAAGCELVVWTAATEDYGSWVLDSLSGAPAVHRLFRQHAIPFGPIFLKDLNRLGRDLTRTVIVDNLKENFALTPSNGIFISSWFGDSADRALPPLLRILRELAQSDLPVPEFLRANKSKIAAISGI